MNAASSSGPPEDSGDVLPQPNGRRLAIFAFDGVDPLQVWGMRTGLEANEVVIKIVSNKVGTVFPAGVKQGDESASNIIKSDVALEYTSDSDFDAAFFPSGDDRYLSSLDAAPVIRFARETFRSQKALAAAGKAVPWFMHKVVPGVTSVKAKPEQKYTVSNGVVLGENVADQDTSLWKKLTEGMTDITFASTFMDAVAEHQHPNRDVSAVPP